MVGWDIALFRVINNLVGVSPFLNALGRFGALYLIWIIFFIAIVFFFRTKRFRGLLTMAIACGTAYGSNFFFSLMRFRYRPFAILTDVHQLITKSPLEKSFPSDHATLSFVIAMSVFLYHRTLGSILLVLAGVVALSRVFVGVHFPLDVVTGTVLGCFWAWIANAVVKKISKRGIYR